MSSEIKTKKQKVKSSPLKEKPVKNKVKSKKSAKNEPSDWKEYHSEKKRLHKEYKEAKLLKTLKKQKFLEEQKQLEEIETNQTKENVEKFYTVSIALPGSILDNAQSPELRTYLGGQIARAAAVFCVNEIVIFDEKSNSTQCEKTTEGEFTGIGKKGHANVQLARILQYLECPQYLRKYFFPMHKDLEYAGLLNPLDSLHHLRVDDESSYREGVVSKHPATEKGSLANIGLNKEVQIDQVIVPGVRVTVKLKIGKSSKKLKGKVVSPTAPHSESGIYWGYTVRLASTFNEVFKECPYENGYDLTIGTSEHGQDATGITFAKSKHILIVFGGLNGLEYCLENDESIASNDITQMFHHYVNACPQQGSKTIRTEEAILIALAVLKPKFVK